MVSVQPKVNSAMHVEAITTTLHYASKGDTSSKEALSPTNAVPAMDIAPATPHIGTSTKVIAHIVIPGPLPAAPHIALPMVHQSGAPHVPKGAIHPTHTTRMLFQLTTSQLATKLKVCCTQRELQMAK